MKDHKATLASVHWGSDEAKGDLELDSYFVKIPGFSEVIGGSKRFVIGRKGTGKTAICERIRIDCDQNPLWFQASISLQNFPVSLIRDMKDKSFRDKAQYVPIWKFLICLELGRLILRDNGAGPNGVLTELEKFVETNFPSTGFGFLDTLTTIRSRESKVLVGAPWLHKKANETSQVEAREAVHVLRVAEILIEQISRIQSPCTFYILIDELDEGYRAGDSGIRLLLLALLRAVEDIYLSLRGSAVNFRPVLVLRSDIYDALDDNDLNKYHDFVLDLKWSGHPEHPMSLRKIVDARISASLDDSEGWNTIISSRLSRRLSQQIWWDLVHQTYNRPRDIVKFLKICSHFGKMHPLNFEIAYQAQKDYSDWLRAEVGNELHVYLSAWREVLRCITRLGKATIVSTALLKEIEEDSNVAIWMQNNNVDARKVCELLFDFGVIGNISSNDRWLFRHEEEDLAWEPRLRTIVHPGLVRKLKVSIGDQISDRWSQRRNPR